MMNKNWTMCCMTFALVWSGVGSAALIDRGGGMIYDSALDVTWLQDANYAMTSGYDADGNMTWDGAMAWASGLAVGGYNDWRLPTFDPNNPRPTTPTATNEFGSLWDELGGGALIGAATDITPFFNLPLQAGGSEWYWTGLEDATDPSSAWRMSMNCACWDSPLKDREYYAWAVRSGDVSVPEPTTISLLGVGLAGLGWARRRRA
jgi:hypothetical protein